MEFCMGLKEIRTHCRKCISRSVIVALSAQPPGVNELCVDIAMNTPLRLNGEENTKDIKK
jgi:hypothetical protein